MPNGTIFGGKEYILGCMQLERNFFGSINEPDEFMWYKKLSQVIKQGIEDCADEREIQYLEQCKEKCLKEIKILKKIEIE